MYMLIKKKKKSNIEALSVTRECIYAHAGARIIKSGRTGGTRETITIAIHPSSDNPREIFKSLLYMDFFLGVRARYCFKSLPFAFRISSYSFSPFHP